MTDTDIQEKYVLWAYGIQWAGLVMPPVVIVSLAYLLVMRPRITHAELRSHINWQLATCGVIAALIPIGLGLLFKRSSVPGAFKSRISILSGLTDLGDEFGYSTGSTK